jgi:ATP-dependent RNA/DNA helicase IGHMBP2
MREEGRPSRVAVASAIASGFGAPEASASANHRPNWTKGSGSRSISTAGSYRMRERHFANLERLLELEARAEAEQEDRLEEGGALEDLVIADERPGLGGRNILKLVHEKKTPLPWTRFEAGSPVRLSTEERHTKKVERGVVVTKTELEIEVAFDAFFEVADEEAVFRLDLAHDAASIDRQRTALRIAARAKSDRTGQLVGVLVEEKSPLFGERASDLTWLDPALNNSQREAVVFALSAVDVALIHGPPGTGKTSTLIEVIRQAIKRGDKVLASAPSNLAADNLLERLVAAGENVVRVGHPARVLPALVDHALDVMVEKHGDVAAAKKLLREAVALFRKADRWTRAKPEPGEKARLRSEARALLADARKLEDQAAQRILASADVIVSTTSIDSRVVGERRFDLLVIDEACQSTEPGCWVPLVRADRVVLAGDHRQLPPTIVSVQAAKEGFGISLFERLAEQHGEEITRLLDVQYRMNTEIMEFSSQELYEGKLLADRSAADRVLADLPGVARNELTEKPLLLIDTAGAGYSEELEPDGESRLNREEAAIVARNISALTEAGVVPAAIAVITPYAAQARHVRDLLAERGIAGIEVDTVDGFQGREKEVVIISLVRSNEEREIGFLSDIRRMNVALTRARRKLIVIGDGATLSEEAFYSRLFNYFEQKGAYRTVWED